MTEQTTDSPATGMCTYGEGQASGSGCIERAGHDGAHLVTPGIPAERDWWRAPDSSAGPAPDQRAAVLLWAADIAESLRQFERCTGPRRAAQTSENVGVLRVADELRRLAGEAQQDPTQDGTSPTAYSDGMGRVFCVACPRPDNANVPLTVEYVDHWDLCPSCGRHVVDVAQAAKQPAAVARPGQPETDEETDRG